MDQEPGLSARVYEFIAALAPYWWAIVAGGLFGVEPMLEPFLGPRFKEWSDSKFSKDDRHRIFRWAAVICIFVAGFLAFDDVNKRNRDLQKTLVEIDHSTATYRPLSSLSNFQLRDSALEFAKKMREFEVNIDSRSPIHSKTRDEDSSVLTKKIQDFYSRKKASFSNEFLGQARIIKYEISYRLRRIGIFPPYFDGESTEEDIAKSVFDHGFLAGPSPVTSAANLLETMARLLPDR